MDGGNVESSDSHTTEKKTFTQIFRETCPYYMALGMSYDEFWYGEPERVVAYREANIIKSKKKNQEMWINGMYMISAIQKALDAKGKAKYPEKPFDIFPKTEAEKKEEAEKQRRKVIEFFTQFKQRWDNGNS